MSTKTKDVWIMLFFAILWACGPISYQDLVRNQAIQEKAVVLRGGQ